MTITLNGNIAATAWCSYSLTNMQGQVAFVWISKVSTALNLRDLMSNPAFDPRELYRFTVLQYFKDKREGINWLNGYFRANPMPQLNMTIRHNRSTPVRCIETGQIWRNQSEAAAAQGINQGQLSQHLRRNPGFKSINGQTYENVLDAAKVHAQQYRAGDALP